MTVERGDDVQTNAVGGALLDATQEERFDRITRLAQEYFDVPFALVNFVTPEGVLTKSQPPETSFRYTPLGAGFCEETVRQQGILEVDDAVHDPRFASRKAVTDHGVRFYAGYPIHLASGEAVGTLCLLGREPRTLTGDEREFLEQLGRWAQAELRADGTEGNDAPLDRDPLARATRDGLVADDLALASLAIPFGFVSGDYSAWRQVGRRFVLTLADVMGKGAEAGALAHAVVAALQSDPADEPLAALRRVDAALGEELSAREMFATVFHAVLDTSTGELAYVDAGHGLSLHLSPDGAEQRIRSHNLPLGLLPGGAEWEGGRLAVRPGDRLVSVSDGVLDAYDATLDSLRAVGEDFRRAGDAGVFFDALSVRVAEHEVEDDVTALVLTVH
jgi:hypothetical protein